MPRPENTAVEEVSLPNNEFAKPGSVYVCMNCGRRSRDLLGQKMLTPGWSPSCARGAVLFKSRDLQLNRAGLVCAVKKSAVTSKLN
jgi:hypothetical protein